jgi:low affinity Fe/Cu permease
MIELFGRLARSTSSALGHPIAFALAVAIVVAWALTGPAFGYSETWQLIVNTGTTILTFLMLFLVQNTQNRDARAMHLKLDELLRALKGARNEMIDLENLTEVEIERYCGEFRGLHEKYDAELRRRRGPVPPQETDTEG